MAEQPALPLRERFGEWITDAKERKGEDIDAVKKKRLKEANKLARDTLPVKEEERCARISRALKKVGSGNKKSLPEVRSGRKKSRPGETVPLPTPPRSPVTSNGSSRASIDTTPITDVDEFQDIEDMRASLRHHEAEIASLRLQVKDTKVEVQELRKRYRIASEEVTNAVCRGDDENVKKSTKLEEYLLKQLKQKNQMIDELGDEIVERKEREGEVREKLAEVEGRYKVRSVIPTGKEKPVSDGWSSKEKFDTIGMGKPKKDKTIGKVSTSWEFRRKKGELETPLTAGYQMLRAARWR